MEIEQNSTIPFLDALLIMNATRFIQLCIVKIQVLLYTYTEIRFHPTTGNGGHSKLWYVEHMRHDQLMNI